MQKSLVKIQILVDNSSSWMVKYAKDIAKKLNKDNFKCYYIDRINKITKGDILVLLSCENILRKETLALNKNNLVIHESNLPKGKGWSPLTWQVLEGKNKIPIVLFEANEKIDAGEIYEKDFLTLNGTELLDEIRKLQAKKSYNLIKRFLSNYPNNTGTKQKGKPTYFTRRYPADSELNINLSIKKQLNLLRVIDNIRYPAFINYKGCKYIIKITKDKNYK